MYKLLYNIYFSYKRYEAKHDKSNKNEKKTNIQLFIGYIEAYYNLFMVAWYKKHSSKKKGITSGKRNQKIIVSLTSYSKRIETLWICIETLLRQSMKPDEIILWLAREEFADEADLPNKLLSLKKRGLTIRFCDNLMSHKKYFYVMQEYPDVLVILVDDDMFYPYDTVKKLYNMHLKNPKDICVITAQVMEQGFSSMPSSWRNPKYNESVNHSDRIQIFTGSGSLFPQNSLDKQVFNKEHMLKNCPYADDLWLTFMAYKKGTRITSLSKWRAFPITIYGTSGASLWYINSQEGKNDEQWKKLLQFYPDVVNNMQ